MKDTYGKRTYQCKCGTLNEEYLWNSKLQTTQLECNKCGKWLGINNLKTKSVPQTASIRTPTKNR